MSSKLVSALDTLADAINTKTGNTSKMTIAGMIDAVERMTVVNGGSATNVTVKADALVSGFTALNNAGAVITGTMPIVTPTMASSVPNAVIVPSGYVNSRHVMSVGNVYKGVTTIMPSTSAVTITSGNYITRDVTVTGDSNLVASNIKEGVTVFNVKGTYAGTGVDTFDADALSTDLLEGKTAYNANGKISGSIKNIDSTYLTIIPTSSIQTIPAGVYLNEAITVEAVKGTDTSDATVTAGALLSGVTAYGSNGKISGNIPTVSATMAANVITVPAGYIKTAQQLKVAEAKEPTISGNKITISSGYRWTISSYTIGNVYNTAATTITPSTSGLIIPASSYIAHDVTIQGDTDLIASNIKQGVNIFGVTGDLVTGYDTSDATATIADIRKGKTAYGPHGLITGIYEIQDGAVLFMVTGLPVFKANGEYRKTYATSDKTGRAAVYINSTKTYYFFCNADFNYWYVSTAVGDTENAIAFNDQGYENPWGPYWADLGQSPLSVAFTVNPSIQ